MNQCSLYFSHPSMRTVEYTLMEQPRILCGPLEKKTYIAVLDKRTRLGISRPDPGHGEFGMWKDTGGNWGSNPRDQDWAPTSRTRSRTEAHFRVRKFRATWKCNREKIIKRTLIICEFFPAHFYWLMNLCFMGQSRIPRRSRKQIDDFYL